MQIDKKTIERLQAKQATLIKLANDNLGVGYWGLEKKKKITHEEVVFLFARVFDSLDLGLTSIEEIRTGYPDCIANKNGKQKFIEFEPKSSQFKEHIRKKDDLKKCNYIICWEDDLDKDSPTKEKIKANGIEIKALKPLCDEFKTKKSIREFKWTEDDIRKIKLSRLKVLSAFIKADKNLLTPKEIGKLSGITGRALGGSLTGFFQEKKERLIDHSPYGYKLNEKYKDRIKKVLVDNEII